MSTKRNAKSIAVKVLAGVLIVLALAAVIGVIVKFTGGLTGDFKTFYVTIDGKDIMTVAGGYAISKDAPLEVETKYTFGDAGGEAQGYSVKIVPNPIDGKDFDFILNGDAYSYQAETNLTAGFDIEYGETSFKVYPKGGIEEVLRSVYPDCDITLSDNAGVYENMYAMVISSYNGKSSVTVNFHVEEPVTGVTLDQEVIYF